MTDNFKKSLSTVDIIALTFGAMVGWGWVVLAGGWVASAGLWGAVLAFLLGGSQIWSDRFECLLVKAWGF